MDIDLEELAGIVELLKTADFSEFRYEKGDLRIVLRRGDAPDDGQAAADRAMGTTPPAPSPASARPTAPAAPASPVLPEGTQAISAPLLGTFYGRPKPGEPAFVQAGDRVKPDTVLCIVEVMKLMNSVHAGCTGTIAAVHAQDGQLVEFGQTLFSIRPDAP